MMSSSLPRLYDQIVSRHLREYRQMLFLSGPRQVGKTTTARQMADHYLNWDNPSHQKLIIQVPDAVADALEITSLHAHLPIITFDEIHKLGRWKNWLKGFFDMQAERCRIVVTGSSRLDVFRRGGDSLMGRYFHYRMHPLSVAELLSTALPDEKLLRDPQALPGADWQALWEHGGFPEPFLQRKIAFSRRWRDSRIQQLLREDIRDLTLVREISQIALLAERLIHRSGTSIVMNSLAADLQVAPDTVKSWLDILVSLHFGFLVRPWFKNVNRSLRKEPKWFLRDWSGIDDPGNRAETFVACHLLKAVDGWNDLGLGHFELRYLRDKQQREVDFVVIRNQQPWFLVEVKQSNDRLSPSLAHFQKQLNAPHAFQLVIDREFVAANPFLRNEPTIVPARTLLSQLL